MEISPGSRWCWWLSKLNDVRNQPVHPTTRRPWTNESPQCWQLFPQLWQPGELRPAVLPPHHLQPGPGREGWRKKISHWSWAFNSETDERDARSVCVMTVLVLCWCVWSYGARKCESARDSEQCGGRLTGGGRVGGRHDTTGDVRTPWTQRQHSQSVQTQYYSDTHHHTTHHRQLLHHKHRETEYGLSWESDGKHSDWLISCWWSSFGAVSTEETAVWGKLICKQKSFSNQWNHFWG